MANYHPECSGDPADCRVRTVSTVLTTVAWEPVYDGNGVLTNKDPNTFTSEKVCDTCGAHWTEMRGAMETDAPEGLQIETLTAPGAVR
jgi:hypothetical protein